MANKRKYKSEPDRIINDGRGFKVEVYGPDDESLPKYPTKILSIDEVLEQYKNTLTEKDIEHLKSLKSK